MLTCNDIRADLDARGFTIVEDVVPALTVAAAIAAIEQADASAARRRQGATYAVRNLLQSVPAMRDIAEHGEVQRLVSEVLGPGAICSRAILFDKNPNANWAVPWHQDTTIAVRQRLDAPGFGPWSIKAGVHHVQPPASVLDGMLTVRVHLDDCGEDNAPLRVIPGTHRRGMLDADLLEHVHRSGPAVTCTVRASGALLMRPLLLHASSPANAPGHRRMVHLEWSTTPLPHGLEWNRA